MRLGGVGRNLGASAEFHLAPLEDDSGSLKRLSPKLQAVWGIPGASAPVREDESRILSFCFFPAYLFPFAGLATR